MQHLTNPIKSPDGPEMSAHGDTSVIVRGIAGMLWNGQADEILASARRFLQDGNPTSDRQALRSIALWLMSHPQAADDLRQQIETLPTDRTGSDR